MTKTNCTLNNFTSEQLKSAKWALQDWQKVLREIENVPGLETLHADMMILMANFMVQINNALKKRQELFVAGALNERTNIIRSAKIARLIGGDRRRFGSHGQIQ